MAKLFYAVAFLVTYGSLYPFDFSLSELSGEATRRFLFEWSLFTGRGDVLGNVALFLPYGFFRMLVRKPGRSEAAKLLWLSVWGFVLATVAQVFQLALPSRDAALGDVLWNMLGLSAGRAR